MSTQTNEPHIEVLRVFVDGLPAKFQQVGDKIYVTSEMLFDVSFGVLTVEYLSKSNREEPHDE